MKKYNNSDDPIVNENLKYDLFKFILRNINTKKISINNLPTKVHNSPNLIIKERDHHLRLVQILNVTLHKIKLLNTSLYAQYWFCKIAANTELPKDTGWKSINADNALELIRTKNAYKNKMK